MRPPGTATTAPPVPDPVSTRSGSGCAVPLPGMPVGDARTEPEPEPILCRHCGRTAGNGISCQGFCVADSGY